MDIRIKRAMAAAGIATALGLPLSSQASDGTISFTGAVTANTCTVVVNGGTANATVALPTVGESALTNAVTKTTAAGTFFNMTISACTGTPLNDFGGVAPTSVVIYFEAGPNVDAVTGGLINTTAASSNVEVNLYNASTAGTIVGTRIKPGVIATNSVAQPMATAGIQYFYAGYSTVGAGAAATPGAVTTSVTYSLIYQ
jgi:major type 1 subunit fimbrin (pilin)